MKEYTRKDIIFLTDDPGLENAIGNQVYASNNLTDLLQTANYGNPDLWCETLAFIHKDAYYRPFVTKVEGNYKYYDAIILKEEDKEK